MTTEHTDAQGTVQLMVEEETFRALARSSPWLWSSVQLTRTLVGRENDERVHAWIRRPGLMRVKPDGGEPLAVDDTRDVGRGRGAARYSTAPSRRRSIIARLVGRPALPTLYREKGYGPIAKLAEDPAGEPNADQEFRTPQDPLAPLPVWRADGLVAQRPSDITVVYDDPMYQDYQWVAMLDPAELADGAMPVDAPSDPPGARSPVDGSEAGASATARPAAVDVIELSETEHHGRAAVEALVSPTRAYDPRCSCCPLLFSAVSAAHMREEGAPLPEPLPVFAEAYRVVLDRQTGICVTLRDVGGDHDGEGFDVVIGEVDAEYPETLFRSASSR